VTRCGACLSALLLTVLLVSAVGCGGSSSGQHSVHLSWKASVSNNVVSYNIYRATVPNSYGLLVSMHPTTSYTDSTVQSGQTYHYVVTAVDSAGGESSYSNRVEVAIP
jgi:fibronectin type 3 domain-containing protein